MSNESYRLVTRSDFDGLVCAVLLKEVGIIDDIKFVHPKDMQDGKIDITDNDITTNLPYVPGCRLAFDHHLSETVRNAERAENHIIDPDAPSAARVVYEYYGGSSRFPEAWQDMMAAVDKGDAARFSRDEILAPSGWGLLNFLMDARTGLGRFRDFRISNYQLMMDLIDRCTSLSIDEILALPDVQERVTLYFEHDEMAKVQIRRCATLHGNLVVLDLRNEETIYAVNRFMIYALFPDANISMHVMWGLKQQNTVFAIGKSIINRTSPVNVGELCLAYGGGGHFNAGTCQVENDNAEEKLRAVVTHITENTVPDTPAPVVEHEPEPA
ncbi:MAG: exopolyphosphatase [Gammaproteobacteria bacterium]|nr:exopolyphosphatase [Gammaproteobacteria bacterium]